MKCRGKYFEKFGEIFLLKEDRGRVQRRLEALRSLGKVKKCRKNSEKKIE
jgi:hypothetical protein